jgi:DNA-binding transcriptional ArsR family regulator
MPSADATLDFPQAPPLVRFDVRGAVVMELIWALLLHEGEPSADFPHRASRFSRAPDLEARIRDWWGDGEVCFTEVLVVADRGGVLFESDPERLWAGLAQGAAAPPRFEPLTSETPEDQVLFRTRLARLHDDAGLRTRWLQLLRDTWAAIEPGWVEEGHEVAAAAVWEIRSKLPLLGSYADLFSLAQVHDFCGLLPRLVGESAAAGQEVVLVPAWLARKGFLVSLPERLLWGTPSPSRPPGPSAETRDRARRHKALGDPTRLGIFEATARRPRTVGELARELAVAQPTISNHVRILRDAGLVDQEKGGGRRLVADVARFEQFLDESRRAVVRVDSAITSLA